MNNDIPITPSANARQAARAIDALKRGWSICVQGRSSLCIKAVETWYENNALDNIGDSYDKMLISSSRAATLNMINQHAAADTAIPICLSAGEALTPQIAIAIADPVLDMRHPMKGPFRSHDLDDVDAALAAMELARLAGILPAFVIVPAENDMQRVSVEDVTAYQDSDNLRIASRAKLPVSVNSQAEIIAFRSDADGSEHIALIVGKPDGSPPLTRLHSECLTGDVLGSLKCDCGPQLHHALKQMAQNWGVLLYLRQEGRAIGLINKLRAYALQDQGFDTVDANVRLGFAIDARDFSIAAKMLTLLRIDTVALMTNNPEKILGLEAYDIVVSERVPIKMESNPHNEHYLDTKRDRTGHQL